MAMRMNRQPWDEGGSMGNSITGTGPDSVSSTSLSPALSRDMALMFGQLGVQSFRASVVDLESMAYQSVWSITEQGEVSDDHPERGLDSAFPGAMATIAQLRQASAVHTVVRKLSPRHWAFAWRIDERHVAVAEARYRDRRDLQSDADTALVRLICDTGIRAGNGDSAIAATTAADDIPQLMWPQVDRRRAARAGASRGRMAVILVGLTALLALSVALLAIPAARDQTANQKSESSRFLVMADSTMTQNLSAMLATGDYGDVQTTLSSFESLGYFDGAVVTNARQRVIAIAGAATGARIGDTVPASLAGAAQVFDLMQGSDRSGQLLVTRPQPKDVGGGRTSFYLMLGAAVLAFASAAALAAMVLPRFLRRNRAGD